MKFAERVGVSEIKSRIQYFVSAEVGIRNINTVTIGDPVRQRD